MSQAERFDTRPKVKKRLNLLPENPEKNPRGRFPSWLHRDLPKGDTLWSTSRAVKGKRLHTVCEEAKCPNLTECWSHKTATFLAMGKECTRSCGFCEIDFNKTPLPPESDEPIRVAESVKELGLKHVVITMVARDDLPDGGAAHLVEMMREIRRMNPESTIELLTSDFEGNFDAIDIVIDEEPEIFNHNIETVRELTPRVRHKATYERTLSVLQHVRLRNPHIFVKSGIMVGLGETESQVQQTLRDLHSAGCDIVTIGQYLQASRHKLRVKEFVTPDQFNIYAEYGRQIGIDHVYSGPFVRSSYNAHLVFEQAKRVSRK
ncbi:MAG: Lipoyl synthase [Chlamydiae bacterium]|nr:Lipoyl synthase [Chlamydiota bacterium]